MYVFSSAHCAPRSAKEYGVGHVPSPEERWIDHDGAATEFEAVPRAAGLAPNRGASGAASLPVPASGNEPAAQSLREWRVCSGQPPSPKRDRDGRALSSPPSRPDVRPAGSCIYAGRVRASGYTRASYSTQAGREPADFCRPHTPSAARRISPASRPRNYQRSRRLGDRSRGSKPQSNGPRSLACWRGPSAGRVRILMVCMPSSLGTA